MESEKFEFGQVVPENLDPEEVREELKSRVVVGITGVTEQRRALKTVLKKHVDDNVDNGVSGPDEFLQHARKVSELMETMKTSGLDLYTLRVMYSWWTVLERRVRRLRDK